VVADVGGRGGEGSGVKGRVKGEEVDSARVLGSRCTCTGASPLASAVSSCLRK
jgi:hypothetical protein